MKEHFASLVFLMATTIIIGAGKIAITTLTRRNQRVRLWVALILMGLMTPILFWMYWFLGTSITGKDVLSVSQKTIIFDECSMAIVGSQIAAAALCLLTLWVSSHNAFSRGNNNTWQSKVKHFLSGPPVRDFFIYLVLSLSFFIPVYTFFYLGNLSKYVRTLHDVPENEYITFLLRIAKVIWILSVVYEIRAYLLLVLKRSLDSVTSPPRTMIFQTVTVANLLQSFLCLGVVVFAVIQFYMVFSRGHLGLAATYTNKSAWLLYIGILALLLVFLYFVITESTIFLEMLRSDNVNVLSLSNGGRAGRIVGIPANHALPPQELLAAAPPVETAPTAVSPQQKMYGDIHQIMIRKAKQQKHTTFNPAQHLTSDEKRILGRQRGNNKSLQQLADKLYLRRKHIAFFHRDLLNKSKPQA